MMRRFARRLGLSLLTLWLVSLAVFFATEALPGDAATALIPPQERTPENVALVRERLGLNRPSYERYLAWTGRGLTGDWGESLAWREPITKLVGPRLRNTTLMAAAATLVGVPLAVGLGVLAGLCRDRWPDLAISGGALIGMSLPEFVVGSLLILLFAIGWGIVPAVTTVPADAPIADLLPSLWLPTATLAVGLIGYVLRLVRTSLVDVLGSDYVQMAELKGVPWRRVVVRHALPSALLPTIHVVALTVAGLLGGVVIVESVFNYPGIGTLLVEGIYDRDLPLVQALVLLAAAVQIGLSLLADAASLLLNPRLRAARG